MASRERSPLAPELPTIAQAGYPDFEYDGYSVLAAPAGTPEPVVALLEREVLRVLVAPEFQEKYRAQDILITPMSSAVTTTRIKSDFEKWARVVKAAGMRID
jgi:tripartite-type tricarboxylate transporter receptor subunit TctC